MERRREQLHEGSSVSLPVWAHSFLEEIGYEAELRRGEKNPETADNRIENLRELMATLPASTENPAEGLQNFWTN